MKFHWTPLCIVGAIASAIPSASSHELHLPYLPTLQPENPVDTYLSIKWAIQNGSLYANNDQIFPPAMSMQLHAPLYESHRNIQLEEDDVEIAYSINARPIPAGENGSKNGILRIHIELFDKEGQSVTPHAVALDLLDHPDGTHRITRIRLDALRGHRTPKPWQMKFWKTHVNTLFNHKGKQDLSKSKSTPPPAQAPAKPASVQAAEKNTPSNSYIAYIFSPYWSPSAYVASSERESHGHHHPHHHQHQNDSFLRLVRPVILPAILGVGACLVACLVGFFVGHLIMSFSTRLGWRRNSTSQRRHSYSDSASLEEGNFSEKTHLMIPEIHLTQPDQ